MEQNTRMADLIKVLQAWDKDRFQGCIILHFNKDTKKLESMSPMVQVDSVQQLFDTMLDARNCIQSFLDDLMNKGLAHN